jgi:FlaG/FlaF family flagellin (archaellin)
MKNKKAVSVLIGYVLLIAGIIVVSGIVYVWLRSYVPRPSIECPDGVSLFIEDVNCQGTNLNLSIRNNGRFEVNGYFIKATTSPEQTLATLDISEKIVAGGNEQAGIVLFDKPGGILGPGESAGEAEYSLDSSINSIEITPIRYEVIEGRNTLISCTNAKIKESVNC